MNSATYIIRKYPDVSDAVLAAADEAVSTEHIRDGKGYMIYEKCHQHMLDAGCQYGLTGRYERTTAGRTLRMQALDEVAQEMDEADAEARLPERDYRHEDWAH